MESEYRLQMKGITKQFPGVLALDGVDLDLKKGEVLALIGENGAGKSTLIKTLSGAYKADKGEIYLDGTLIPQESTPKQRMDLGIAIIYQELNYMDEMSIAENLFMADLPVKSFLKTVDYKTLGKKASELLQKFDLNYNPFTLVKKLTVAEKQMVEILRAVSRDVKVLVMDEPTSALSETEIARLFTFIKSLQESGVSIVYISHKLDEVFAVADNVQVMRDGHRVGYLATADATQNQLVEMMVGREINDMYPKEETQIGENIISVKNLNCEIAKNVSFTARRGEILGLFGLIGSGRTEVVEGLIGKKEGTVGEIVLDGKKVKIRNPIDAKKAGIAYVPADRAKEGLVLMHSVKYNVTLTEIDKMRKGLMIDKKKETKEVEGWIKKINIKTPNMNVAVDSLSGGNKQKVVIAKWLLADPKVLILNEPTRGIDVGAKVEIYKLMQELCQKGMAVIMVSSEIPETVGIADRILVFRDGEVRAEFERKDFTQKAILEVAVGGEK